MQQQNFSFRRHTSADWDFYWAGVVEVLTLQDNVISPQDEQLEREHFASRDLRIAVSASAENVGFVSLRTCSRAPHRCEGAWSETHLFVDLVFVCDAFRRQGVGRALYQEAEKTAKELQLPCILLDVYANNDRSIKFHVSMGYELKWSVMKRDIALAPDESACLEQDKGRFRFLAFDSKKERDAKLLRDAIEAFNRVEGPKDTSLRDFDQFVQLFGANTVVCENRANAELVGLYVGSITQKVPYGSYPGDYDWPFLFLDCAYVVLHLQRSGVASAMLRNALAHCAATRPDVKYCLSAMAWANEPYVAWHKRNGFDEYVGLFEKRFVK